MECKIKIDFNGNQYKYCQTLLNVESHKKTEIFTNCEKSSWIQIWII